MGRWGALLAVSVLLCACGEAGRESSPSAPESGAWAEGVLARYSGGEITIAEIDALILRTSASERPAPGADLDAWYSDRVRGLAMDRLLLADARALGLADDAAFQVRRAAVQRQLAVQSCLESLLPGYATIDPERIQSAYDSRKDEFLAPERRAVFYLYKRRAAPESGPALESTMAALRERVLRGESFQRLAQAESDSESRHRQGSLGWIVRGDLPESFETVIFALEEGVPSQPLMTRDGAHLFLVEDVLPERQAALSEVAPQLRSQLQAEQVAQAVDEVAAKNPSPVVRIVSRDELQQRVDQGDEAAEVLVASDHALTLGEFRTRVGRVLGEQAPAGGESAAISNEAAWALLDRLYRHEVAFEHCREQGLIADPQVDQRLATWEAGALVAQMRQQRLRERVLADPARLALYFQSNIGQFTPSVQWSLRRLRVPFETPAEARQRMALLERAAEESVRLDDLQAQLGGAVEELGWLTLPRMRALHAELPQRIAPLQPGQLASPIRLGGNLEMFELSERREPEPPPLEQVRDEVASAYLRQYASEVYAGYEAERLAEAGFELSSERLAELRQSGLPSGQVSVDMLDALLGGS
jgi:hypothetical protein